MGVKVTNNAFGTLSAAVNSTATTITVDSGQGGRFPSLGVDDYFFATLVDTANNLEIVKVTARSADSMTAVRGQDGTTALSFAIGDRIELRPVAALFEEFAQTTGGTITNTQTFDTTSELAAVFDRSDDGGIVSFKRNGSEVGRVNVSSSDNLEITATSGGGAGLQLWGGGGTDPIVSPMKEGTVIDDAVDLGRTSERFRDLYLSGGVYLGGTGSVNHLDDYEEGTFSVTSTRDGTGEDSGGWHTRYVKVGRMVMVTISTNTYVRHAGSGYSTGQIFKITSNLPFTPASRGGSTVAHTRTLASADNVAIGWEKNSAVIYLNSNGANNGYNLSHNVTTGSTQTNITLIWSGVFYTDS